MKFARNLTLRERRSRPEYENENSERNDCQGKVSRTAPKTDSGPLAIERTPTPRLRRVTRGHGLAVMQARCSQRRSAQPFSTCLQLRQSRGIQQNVDVAPPIFNAFRDELMSPAAVACHREKTRGDGGVNSR